MASRGYGRNPPWLAPAATTPPLKVPSPTSAPAPVTSDETLVLRGSLSKNARGEFRGKRVDCNVDALERAAACGAMNPAGQELTAAVLEEELELRGERSRKRRAFDADPSVLVRPLLGLAGIGFKAIRVSEHLRSSWLVAMASECLKVDMYQVEPLGCR